MQSWANSFLFGVGIGIAVCVVIGVGQKMPVVLSGRLQICVDISFVLSNNAEWKANETQVVWSQVRILELANFYHEDPSQTVGHLIMLAFIFHF